MSKVTVLTDRFDRALLYATHVHGGQVRKGTSTRMWRIYGGRDGLRVSGSPPLQLD
jgi:hypothetical protein